MDRNKEVHSLKEKIFTKHRKIEMIILTVLIGIFVASMLFGRYYNYINTDKSNTPKSIKESETVKQQEYNYIIKT